MISTHEQNTNEQTTKKQPKKIYQCFLCNKIFRHKGHYKEHKNKKFPCGIPQNEIEKKIKIEIEKQINILINPIIKENKKLKLEIEKLNNFNNYLQNIIF